MTPARIAVAPPAYFPRLVYIALIQHVDHFILADTFPFRQRSFQDRSKVRSPQGWHWISIPVVGHREGAPLPEVEIRTAGRWREKHWRSFLYNYRTTPYFEFFEDSFRPFFERAWGRLAPCLCRSVQLTADLFGVRTRITRASALSGTPCTYADIVTAVSPDALVVLDASEPVDLPGNVSVYECTYEQEPYRQNFEGFVPGMSALDLMFNYGPEARRVLTDGRTVASHSREAPGAHPGSQPTGSSQA